MTKWLKMIVGGICNLIVLVTFALILVVLSENRVVHRVLAATSGSISELNSNRVVLTTQNAGSFVGKKEPLAQDDPNEIQRTFIAFRGIPYANPVQRWKPPEPLDLKSTPHQAGDFKPPCSQWSPIKRKTIGVPDCLYLNVFIPYFPYTSKRPVVGSQSSWTVEPNNLLPVLVYVHGGEFISGSATQYSPDAILKREKCVLVTFNYRLGVLGFLSSGSEELRGNYGLMDQVACLEWIQKYIHIFGGNPLRVTIFGSVEHLLLANLTDNDGRMGRSNLFHAAIITPQSTSVLNPFAKFDSKEGAKQFLKQLAETVGCNNYQANIVNSTSYSGLIECLREADTDTLIRSQTKLLTFHNLPFGHIGANPMGPVVDDTLLIDEPEVLFRAGKFPEIPIMVGLSANEGYNPFLEFYLKLYRKNKGEKKEDSPEEKCDLTQILTEEDTKTLLRSILQTIMAAVPDMNKNGAFERVFQSVWNYYFGSIGKSWNAEIENVVQKLFRLFGDMLVNTGHCELLQSLSQNSKAPIYSYVFSHGIGNNRFAEFFKTSKTIFENSEGMQGPKRPKRSLHLSLDTPWKETYYLFSPIRSLENYSVSHDSTAESTDERTSIESFVIDDLKITDALAKIWVSFAKDQHPGQAIKELLNYTDWFRMKAGDRSQNYYLISNLPLQNGMRSDFRKAECQFWMNTVPQIRKLSKVIQDLEPFPILFWSSVAVVILFGLIIITLIVLIVCVKQRTGSYGGEQIYLNRARHL